MREINDFSRVVREFAWVGGCTVAAMLFAKLTEDKGGQTLFVTLTFYVASAVVRFLFSKWQKRA